MAHNMGLLTEPAAWSPVLPPYHVALILWLLCRLLSQETDLVMPHGCSSASLAYPVPFNSHVRDAQGS